MLEGMELLQLYQFRLETLRDKAHLIQTSIGDQAAQMDHDKLAVLAVRRRLVESLLETMEWEFDVFLEREKEALVSFRLDVDRLLTLCETILNEVESDLS